MWVEREQLLRRGGGGGDGNSLCLMAVDVSARALGKGWEG